MNAPLKITCTVDESCAALGIGRTKFYTLVAEGKIDTCKVGGRTVATVESLHRLVADARAAKHEREAA